MRGSPPTAGISPPILSQRVGERTGWLWAQSTENLSQGQIPCLSGKMQLIFAILGLRYKSTCSIDLKYGANFGICQKIPVNIAENLFDVAGNFIGEQGNFWALIFGIEAGVFAWRAQPRKFSAIM